MQADPSSYQGLRNGDWVVVDGLTGETFFSSLDSRVISPERALRALVRLASSGNLVVLGWYRH